jgi:hypothetical protein
VETIVISGRSGCRGLFALSTLARWCRIRSYLDSAANHGLTVLDAISAALAGEPGLPAVPHAA